MDRDYLLLDVFTDQRFGGNQLAVFPHADGLSDATMQAVARELNLSETVFAHAPAGGGDFGLRIFTPGMELPFAGHPTIGAAIALSSASERSELVLEEAAGPVHVRLETRDGRRFATLTSPKLAQALAVDIAREAAAATVGLPPAALAPVAPAAYSAGVPFLFVPVGSLEDLANVRLDLAQWRRHVADSAAPHVVALWIDDWRAGSEAHMRMFSPPMGIVEDPATGAAAAALAGLFLDQQAPGDGLRRWTIRQGEFMGRPSRIHLEADIVGGRLAAIRVGGTAVTVGRGTLHLG